jgi:sec-independent protein translocase protein TatA
MSHNAPCHPFEEIDMCSLGSTELLIILAIIVLLFGSTRLPQLGKALGETVKNFKHGSGAPEEDKGSSPSFPSSSEKKAIEVHPVAQLLEGEENPAEEKVKGQQRS